jgi:hypothetical protein
MFMNMKEYGKVQIMNQKGFINLRALSDYTAFIFCERNLHFLELCNCSKIDESFLIHDLNLSGFDLVILPSDKALPYM